MLGKIGGGSYSFTPNNPYYYNREAVLQFCKTLEQMLQAGWTVYYTDDNQIRMTSPEQPPEEYHPLTAACCHLGGINLECSDLDTVADVLDLDSATIICIDSAVENQPLISTAIIGSSKKNEEHNFSLLRHKIEWHLELIPWWRLDKRVLAKIF